MDTVWLRSAARWLLSSNTRELVKVDSCAHARETTLCAGLRNLADFDAAEIGTSTSAIKYANLANASGTVIVGFVEPVPDTASKSPMQRFLEFHNGPGVQHIAIVADDIFATLRRMHGAGAASGLGFMPRPSKAYYECVSAFFLRQLDAVPD